MPERVALDTYNPRDHNLAAHTESHPYVEMSGLVGSVPGMTEFTLDGEPICEDSFMALWRAHADYQREVDQHGGGRFFRRGTTTVHFDPNITT